MNKKNTKETGKRAYLSVMLLFLAIISITAATAAWFTIADFSRVKSVGLDISAGNNLRFDLDAHRELSQYQKTLTFAEIAERIQKEQGFDPKTTPLEPVTTEDHEKFTWEDGTEVDKKSGAYLEFVLHFMAAEDMVVHLTSADSAGQSDGTRITSKNDGLVDAMRISFTEGKNTSVYDPGKGVDSGGSGEFGLPEGSQMVLKDENALFSLKAEQDLPVTVRIWLEGTDEACTDELKGADYSIQLRFEGTDENNRSLDGTEYVNKTSSKK